MKAYRKAMSVFMAVVMAFSMSGCFGGLSKLTRRTEKEMLEIAYEYKNPTWLQELLADCSKKELLSYFKQMLSRSIFNDRFYLAEMIYDMGVDLNGQAVVASLSHELDYQGVQFLIDLGADVNLKDSDGYSPLFYAMLNAGGQWEASGYYLAKLLVEYGAEPYPEMFHNEYEGDPERNVGNGAYRQIAHSPLTAQYLLGVLLDSGKESGLPKAVEYAILGESEKALDELRSGNTVSDVDMGLISYYFGYFATMEQYRQLADIWGRYSRPPASCVAGAGNAEVLKRLYLDKDPDNEESEEYVLDFQSCDMLISAMQMDQTEVVKLLLSYDSINHQWKNNVWHRAFSGGFEGFKMLYDFWEENVEGGFTENLIEQFYPDIGRGSIDKYKKIDFLFEQGFDCRYITFNHCNADTIKYLYQKGRPMMPNDLDMVTSWCKPDEVKAVIDDGRIDINYAFCFDIRDSTQIELRYDEDAIRYKYTGYSKVGEGFMTYEELCDSAEENYQPIYMFTEKLSPEMLQYAIDCGVEIPDDCLKYSYNISAANVKVLLDNGANVDVTASEYPCRGGGMVSTGKEYKLKEYYKMCSRDDLAKLLDEYD